MNNLKHSWKEILQITGGVLLILITIIFLLMYKGEVSNIDLNLPLEEQAKLSGKDISEFVPKPTNTPSLEEIAQESSVTLEDLMPVPSNVPPLEETIKN